MKKDREALARAWFCGDMDTQQRLAGKRPSLDTARSEHSVGITNSSVVTHRVSTADGQGLSAEGSADTVLGAAVPARRATGKGKRQRVQASPWQTDLKQCVAPGAAPDPCEECDTMWNAVRKSASSGQAEEHAPGLHHRLAILEVNAPRCRA